MKLKTILYIFFILIHYFSFSQTTKIYEIQGNGQSSTYEDQYVNTEGIVTLCLFGQNQINGFFIQDTIGDNNTNTSDGIFVYGSQNVQEGDYISLTGKVLEYYDKTELSYISNLQIISSNNKIPYTYINFPEDILNNYNYEQFEGMAICFNQTLHLVSNSNLQYSGTLVFSSKRLRSPTDIALPLSNLYYETLDWNDIDYLYLDDASNYHYPTPIPFLDTNGTRRTGEKIDDLKAVLDYNGGEWKFYPTENLNFYGNQRSDISPEAPSSYDLKICSFNLENYLNESSLQKARVIKTLKAIDADIFGLCEVKQGQQYIQSLVDSLNIALNSNVYSYINLQQLNSTYTCSQIIYKADIVTPINSPNILNSVGPYNRKLSQVFSVNNTDFSFIFSINHLKAKSGIGTALDNDQNDGQSVYNYTRTLEAQAIVDNLENLKENYNTDKVIIMGDLNSCDREDPMEVFRNAGYENQVIRFDSTQYSYRYDYNVQFLDYVLANDEVYSFVQYATNWHINADEPSFLDWENCDNSQNFLFRSSDHDPVIVFLNISQNNLNIRNHDFVNVFPNPVFDVLSFSSTEKINKFSIYSIDGQLIKTFDIDAFSEKINLNFLLNGIFFIEFITKNNNKIIKKIIKKN